MESPVDCRNIAPQALNALVGLDELVMSCSFEACAASSGVETSLLHLIKVRAAQINGCASCIDLHTRGARADGETERRLYALSAWRAAPLFTPRERAALAWAEAVTLVVGRRVPDWVYEAAREHLDDTELTILAMAVVTISGQSRPITGAGAASRTCETSPGPVADRACPCSPS